MDPNVQKWDMIILCRDREACHLEKAYSATRRLLDYRSPSSFGLLSFHGSCMSNPSAFDGLRSSRLGFLVSPSGSCRVFLNPNPYLTLNTYPVIPIVSIFFSVIPI